ncbi:MAG: HEAT repeat domain-containing protein [Planctomycetes bacterium]|nr:HEAT repeat domain-containing protein [Planctomycetota bacterium]
MASRVLPVSVRFLALAAAVALFATGCRSFDHDLVVVSGDTASTRQMVHATLAIGDMGSKETEERLVSELAQISRPELRVNAARLMGAIGHPGFKSALETAKKDADSRVAAAAAEALAALPNAQAPRQLRANLYDSRFLVRAASAKALGRLRNPVAVPDLIERADNDPDWYVRVEAVTALGRIGSTTAVAWLDRCAKDPAADPEIAEEARAWLP